LADEGLKLALVSNVPLPGALYRKILSRHGLESLFDCFQFSYDSGHRKPSPFMLRAALSEIGVPASQAVMVGDRRASDVAAGRAAGMATVWIESEHAVGPRPDRTVGSIRELPTVVAELTV
jgi:HAD superfamily hydrolase (TIGR01549 family)